MKILSGDCVSVMSQMEHESIDSIVTDPPYHFTSIVKRFGADGAAPAKSDGATGVYERSSRGFMGKTWDGGDVAFRPETWAAALRVLKPGGHLVAFGAPKNYHRLACAIEDAGFEIRDSLMWVFGSGFPKSHNLDGDRQGWGTALKPAYEPIILARKPLIGTVAENVLAHGTGALNIDACRVATTDALGGGAEKRVAIEGKHEGWSRPWMHDADAVQAHATRVRANVEKAEALGRWPANLVHDGSEEVLAGFPETKSGKPGVMRKGTNDGAAYGAESRPPGTLMTGFGDEGSAARFFYCAKADKNDRAGSKHPTGGSDLGRWPANLVHDGSEEVLAAFPDRKGAVSNGKSGVNEVYNGGWGARPQVPGYADEGSAARFFYCAKASKTDRAGSKHPTVKPIALMRWLVRLITPPGGVVLDPFAGSGTTGQAAMEEGFDAVLIEREAEYLADIRRRLGVMPSLEDMLA